MEAAERHPETAQMMIMNPLSGGGLRGLFSTHPSTEERVERLLAMARAPAALTPARARAQVGAGAADNGDAVRPPCAAIALVRSSLLVAALLAGCDLLGIESAEKIAAAPGSRRQGRSAAPAATPAARSRTATR